MKGAKMVVQYGADDHVSEFDGFDVTKELGSFVDGRFEEEGR